MKKQYTIILSTICLMVCLSMVYQFFDKTNMWSVFQVSEKLINCLSGILLYYFIPNTHTTELGRIMLLKIKCCVLVWCVFCIASLIIVLALRLFSIQLNYWASLGICSFFLLIYFVNLFKCYKKTSDPINDHHWFYVITLPNSIGGFMLASILVGLNIFNLAMPMTGFAIYGKGFIYKYKKGRLIKQEISKEYVKYNTIVLDTGFEINKTTQNKLNKDIENKKKWKPWRNCFNGLQHFGLVKNLLRSKSHVLEKFV